jgi:hypothetical protein
MLNNASYHSGIQGLSTITVLVLLAKLTSYQEGAYCAGIRFISTLPDSIKSSNRDVKVLQPALKDYLFFSHCIYSIEEFTSTENF